VSAFPSTRTRRWTRVECERLVEFGVFQPDERLELIDGLVVVREPQGSRHAGTIRRVLAALRHALGDSWQIDSQLPIALDADSEPEPDVAVVPRDPGTYLDAHPSRAVPDPCRRSPALTSAATRLSISADYRRRSR